MAEERRLIAVVAAVAVGLVACGSGHAYSASFRSNYLNECGPLFGTAVCECQLAKIEANISQVKLVQEEKKSALGGPREIRIVGRATAECAKRELLNSKGTE